MKTVLLFLGLLCLVSCGMPDIRIKRKVADREIVGIWHLDPASSALAADYDGDDYRMDPEKPHTIVFRSDGTCRYRSVMQMPTRFVDAEGEWSIVPTADDSKGCMVEMRLKLDDGETKCALDFREKSGALVLWEFWSDPDLWNLLEYKRDTADR